MFEITANAAMLDDSLYVVPVIFEISIEGLAQLPDYIRITAGYDPGWFTADAGL